MSCPDRGVLRSFIDGELSPQEANVVQIHLEACQSCAREVAALKETSVMVSSQMNLLAPISHDISEARARSLLSLRMKTEENNPRVGRFIRRFGIMMRRLSQPRWRFGAITSALLAIVLLVTFTPVGSAADNFLSIFRVKKIQTISLDSTSLQNAPTMKDLGVLDAGTKPQSRVVGSATEASAVAGFPVSLPSSLPAGFGNSEINVTDGTSFRFTFDLPKIEAYLSATGVRGIDLPANLNGATVQAQFAPQVTLSYHSSTKDKFLSLGVTKSPVLDVPSDLDVDYLRDQLLKFPGLSSETRSELMSIQDWKNTAIVPVPSGGTSRNVSINGADGVLISAGRANSMQAVLWLKNDVIYGLSGNVTEDELLATAQSIK